jgi:hypothetical protein
VNCPTAGAYRFHSDAEWGRENLADEREGSLPGASIDWVEGGSGIVDGRDCAITARSANMIEMAGASRRSPCAGMVVAHVPRSGRSMTCLRPPLTHDQAVDLSASFSRATTESMRAAIRSAPATADARPAKVNYTLGDDCVRCRGEMRVSDPLME